LVFHGSTLPISKAVIGHDPDSIPVISNETFVKHLSYKINKFLVAASEFLTLLFPTVTTGHFAFHTPAIRVKCLVKISLTSASEYFVKVYFLLKSRA
jgi:hypothetical protein